MIQQFPTKEALGKAAAQLFVSCAQEAVAKNGRFLVALSGGSTPAMLFKLLRERPYREQIDWQNTIVFWSDERIVPPTDDGSNYKQAHDLLLSHVPIPPDNIIRAKGELLPQTAVLDYRQQLQTITSSGLPTFDLILLGMGTDGHTASLFPGPTTPEEETETVIAVTADYDGRPAHRITFTPKLINQATHIAVLVTGQNKADTLHHIIHGAKDVQTWPIQRIQPTQGQLIWLVDETAASKLTTHNP